MNVFHIDLPRGMSFSVKPLDYLSARVLDKNGQHCYRQMDLNPRFWEYLLTCEEGCLAEQVYEFNNQLPSYNLFILNKITNVLKQKSVQAGIDFDSYGANFPEDIKSSSEKLFYFVNNEPFVHWYSEFLNSTQELSAGLAEADIISLGIDSANGLVQAAVLATYIKREYPDKFVVLARHEYENYTLSDCVAELIENKYFFNIFDAIACDSESRSQTLAGIANYIENRDESVLANIAFKRGEEVIGKQSIATDEMEDIHSAKNTDFQDAYFNSTLIPRAKMTYLMSIMGNTCYYGKCSFCVQNNKYKGKAKRQEEKMVSLCVDRISALVERYDIKSINFLDQAVSHKTLRLLCNKLIENKIKINWYVRMLFHDSLDDELIALLEQAGCREILFGMESVNPETLGMMKKVRSGMDDEQRLNLLSRLSAHNIDVCLNIITHFPTESDAAFMNTTGAFLKKCRQQLNNITYVINRFSLFRNSEIHRNPLQYNIKNVVKITDYDMQIVYDYRDGFSRLSSGSSELTNQVHQLLSPRAENGERVTTPAQLYAWFNYLKDSSISLYYRRATGRFIRDEWAIEFYQSDRCRHYQAVYPAALRLLTKSKLIIGANSYLGQNLVKNSDTENIIISSRSCPNEILRGADIPFIKEDLVAANTRLLAAEPEILEIVSRPVSADFEINLAFYSNLKSLINTYCKRKHLKAIRFYSTQLVYSTPADSRRLDSSEKAAPEEVYEYFKVDFEVFLKFINKKYAVNVEVYRLPLLFGGLITEKQRQMQLIYQWMDYHKRGVAWLFNHSDKKKFGNSWLNTDIFTKWLAKKEFDNGYHEMNVSTGDFTYWELGKCFKEIFKESNAEHTEDNFLSMPESCFFIQNESELEPLSLYDEIEKHSVRHISGR